MPNYETSTLSDNLNIVTGPLNDVWGGVAKFIPKLIVALIIFIIVWWIGAILGRVVAQFIRAIKLDNALKGVGVDATLAKGGFNLDTGAFFGTLVKWFFIIVGLLAAVDVVELQGVRDFLAMVVGKFLPNVIIAALILVVGALIAHAVQRLVTGSAKAADVPSSQLMGGFAKWSIWVLAIIIALGQVGIAGDYMRTLFTGLVAFLVLAGGLSFGLGGRDAAARYIERLRKDINEK